MERFSVKKPFTILVAVIMVLALGYVSLTNLSTDLLPAISLPYMMVITPYPGASPEKVEASVTVPLENALGTISGVKTVYSVNGENYSMVQLEFEDGTNMDSAMVKVSGALEQARAVLPDGAGTPSTLEISMDMVASMYVAVSHDGYDVYELSDYVEREVIPYLQRQNGVASVTSIGLVERTVQVDLNEDKIREVNDRILGKTNEALDDAKEQLDAAKKQVEEGQKLLQEQESVFGSTVSGALFGQLGSGVQGAAAALKSRLGTLTATLQDLQYALDTQGAQAQEQAQAGVSDLADRITEAQNALADINGQIGSVQQQLAALEAELQAAVDELQNAPAEQILDDISSGAEEGAEALEELAQQSMEELQLRIDELNAQIAQAQSDLAYLEQERLYWEQTVADLLAELGQTDGSPEQIAETLDNSPEAWAIRDELAALLQEAAEQTGANADSVSSLMEMVTSMARIYGRAAALLERLSALDVNGLLSAQIAQAWQALNNLGAAMDSAPAVLDTLELAFAGLTQGQLDAALGFSAAASALSSAEQQLQAAEQQYETSRSQALANANVDQLVTASTLSSLIYAQNFAMPAGYIDDREDQSWLLKVGEEYETTGDIAEALLVKNDVLGTIRLSDVADVTVIDDAGESYAKLNGEQGVILSIFKASTASTNDVSKACRKAFDEMEEISEGTHLVPLVDQGVYITIIIRSVLSSMVLGSLLAILILALFLRDLRPTLVVGISIPLSVLFAIVLIYFSDLSLDVMTLSGLALGIGMLVDNSIVVMENVFRLRQSGVAAPRAAVQGARQVRGAIVASTLTTVCVFLPMVFTTGTVRELLLPMALSIGYCLTASLLTALTVVPASASTIMRNVKPKEHRFSDLVQDLYGRLLGWCLRFKPVPLALAVGLLAFSVWMVLRMGIVLLPEMTTNSVQVNIATAEDMDRQASYDEVDAIMEQIRKVEGVLNVGIMDQGSSAGFLAAAASDSTSFGRYICFVEAPEDADSELVYRICSDIEAIPVSKGCRINAQASGMSDMTSLLSGAGLTIEIFGRDLDKLQEISEDVQAIIRQEEGFSRLSDGTEEGDPTLHLIIDRDKVMEKGLTVAQVYAEIAARLQTTVPSTTVTVDGIEMDVVVRDGTEPLTRENLMDMELSQPQGMGGMSASSMGSAMSGMGSSTGSMGSAMSGMGSSMGSMGSAMSGMDASSMGSMADMFSSAGGSGAGSSMGAMFGQETDSADGGSGTLEPGFTMGAAADAAEEENSSENTDGVIYLRDVAEVEETASLSTVTRRNQTRYLTLTAASEPGYNTALQVRELQPKIDAYNQTLPNGYNVEIAGQNTEIQKMLTQMAKLMLLAFLFIYLVMVAQFQSLLSPFIVLFTIPLAFTGGLIGLLLAGQELSMLSLMGFLVLMGTVVNNGIVFVDYTNQLRLGGLDRRTALIATGKTRMRAILMTALTTILAMGQLIFGKDMGSQMGSGMAIVIAGGLAYATLMTLFIIPVMYDIFFRRQPLQVDTGDDLDDEIDDAGDYIRQMQGEEKMQ